MEVFGNSSKMRGCFNKFTIVAGGSGAVLSFGGGSNFVVVGIAATQSESLYNHKCFNDVTHVYAFGHDPDRSNVTVTAVGMLVTPAAKPSGVITEQIKAYEAARVYTRGSTVSVAMGKDVLTGFLVGMSTSTRSEEYQLQDFQFVLSIPRAYGSGAKSGSNEGDKPISDAQALKNKLTSEGKLGLVAGNKMSGFSGGPHSGFGSGAGSKFGGSHAGFSGGSHSGFGSGAKFKRT